MKTTAGGAGGRSSTAKKYKSPLVEREEFNFAYTIKDQAAQE